MTIMIYESANTRLRPERHGFYKQGMPDWNKHGECWIKISL